MFKRKITSVGRKVKTFISFIGTETKNKQHKYYSLPISTKEMRSGDVVRVDGLPFLSKPSLHTIQRKLPMYWENYQPVQLSSGYWVLREVDDAAKKGVQQQ